MSDTKRTVEATINLQNGMFCHLVDDFLVINNDRQPSIQEINFDLSKTKDRKKIRIVLNVIFTLIFITAALYTQFYPLIALMFLSLWDLRQLKRYRLPINKSKTIPIKNISEIQLKKGALNFNYMDIYIVHDSKKSFIPVQLYDSQSTLDDAKKLASHLGKLTQAPEIEKIKMDAYEIPLNETASYALKDGTLFYTQNKVYDKARQDSYHYIRLIAYFLLAFVLLCIGIKIDGILNRPSNVVDLVVILLFTALLAIPYKFARKALPNKIAIKDVTGFNKGKKRSYIVIKQKYLWSLRVEFDNKYLPKDLDEHLNLNNK